MSRRHPYDHDAELVRAHERLTPRMLKIFFLAREGRSQTQIASELGVSRATVRSALAGINREMDA